MQINKSVLSIYKTPTAERKLIDIIKWSVNKWGKKTAMEYINNIDNTINLVASELLPCNYNKDFSQRFCYVTCQSHYIFFEFKKDKLIVVTFFHTAMHVRERLNEEQLDLGHEIKNVTKT